MIATHHAIQLPLREDNDCDGVITSEDCDDNNNTSTFIAEDSDCDGVLTEDDCNDSDSTNTILSNDYDLDGIESSEDCDDNDGTLLDQNNDQDCDRPHKRNLIVMTTVTLLCHGTLDQDCDGVVDVEFPDGRESFCLCDYFFRWC